MYVTLKFAALVEGFTLENLGLIPDFIRDGWEPYAPQIDEAYQHGGGWRPMRKFSLEIDKNWSCATPIAGGIRLQYEGDRPLMPLAIFGHWLDQETPPLQQDIEFCIFFESSFLAIVSSFGDGTYTFEVSRVD